jgi:hypothetical protein
MIRLRPKIPRASSTVLPKMFPPVVGHESDLKFPVVFSIQLQPSNLNPIIFAPNQDLKRKENTTHSLTPFSPNLKTTPTNQLLFSLTHFLSTPPRSPILSLYIYSNTLCCWTQVFSFRGKARWQKVISSVCALTCVCSY